MIQTHTGHTAERAGGDNSDSNAHKPSKSNGLLIAGGLATSALIVAPYIGDALGISSATVPEIMGNLHQHGLGSGLAGAANSLLNMIPLVGETLSAGGMVTTATSGIFGIGGILLGNYFGKKHHKPSDLKWEKAIKYAALTTSILIALPSILTGISVGLSYLAAFAGAGVASSALTSMATAIGSIGGTGMATAGAGIGSALTHLITCGGAALSVAGSIYLDKSTEAIEENKMNVEIIDKKAIERGKECQIKIRISDDRGKAMTPDDLAEIYTKKLHVMLVDSSLTDYQHIHPDYDKDSGLFVLNFTPKCHGEYNLWCDFKLKNNASNSVIKNKLASEQSHKMPAIIQHTNSVTNDNSNITIESDPPLTAGIASNLKINVTKRSGELVKLQQVMGAYAHLVGFSKDGENLIHCHPLNTSRHDNGELQFHVTPEKNGFTKFFLQIKADNKENVTPFGQYIQSPVKFSERETAPQNFTTHENSAIVERR